MTTPEKPTFTPEQVYQNYLDGLKDYMGGVRRFDFILSLKTDALFGEFIENLINAHPMTDYAGLHATDPNWYEDGHYITGILHPKLYEEMEGYFREKKDVIDRKILEDDQVLTPICHYSSQPGDRRANLLFEVSGGERDDWGQFICCSLEKDFNQFEFHEDTQTINEMKQLARATGRQEISFDEYWKQYLERKRMQKDP